MTDIAQAQAQAQAKFQEGYKILANAGLLDNGIDGGTVAMIVLIIILLIALILGGVGYGTNGFANITPNYDGPCLYGNGIWGEKEKD